jgi:hypothetical protein
MLVEAEAEQVSPTTKTPMTDFTIPIKRLMIFFAKEKTSNVVISVWSIVI